MKIMLASSPAKVREYTERYGYAFWQLRAPVNRHAIADGVPWALDNGCFTRFDRTTWERMVGEAREVAPVFVTLPDIVGDALRTLELFDAFKDYTVGLPRALVIQDGIGRCRIPWDDLAAVFIGGTDRFKFSEEAINVARTAKLLGRWVHVGRVNTAARVENWTQWGDSLDGSGISRFDHMLEAVLHTVRGEHPQNALFHSDAPVQ